MNLKRVAVGGFLLAVVGSAHGGMTVYDLNDVVRLRLEDISFFAVLLLASGFGIRLLEDLHVVFLEGTNGQLAAGLIFHRDPEIRAKTGFVAISPETPPGEIQPISALPTVLARYQSRTNSTPSQKRQ
jgi:hypothetical protein